MTAWVDEGVKCFRRAFKGGTFKGNLGQFSLWSFHPAFWFDLWGVMDPTALGPGMGSALWKLLASKNKVKNLVFFFFPPFSRSRLTHKKMLSLSLFYTVVAVTFRALYSGDRVGWQVVQTRKKPSRSTLTRGRGGWMSPSNPAGRLIQGLRGAAGNTSAWQETLN